MDTTTGFLLGGRVRYAQPVHGYRTGIEPVLLAASIPARRGQRVLEAGTGAGAGLLCLHARVPGLTGIGIERDPGMAELARQNIADNTAPFSVLTADVTAPPTMPAFDHVFANPPWHDPASTRPPDGLRDAATHRNSGGLVAWIEALAGLMAPRATLSLILPVALAGEAIACLHQAGLARLTLVPCWPRAGHAAKIILLQALQGSGPSRISPGLVLHEGQAYTAAAQAILRKGEAMAMMPSTPPRP